MNILLAAILLFGSISQEVKEFSVKAETHLDLDAYEFLKNLQNETNHAEPSKCKKCRSTESVSSEKQNLLVFMSFSVPLESWKEWSIALEKVGGVFVLRGLPGNSFEQLCRKTMLLKNAGVNVSIRIDPEAFEKYKIDSVPAIVNLKNGKYEKVTGNIRLDAALKMFSGE